MKRMITIAVLAAALISCNSGKSVPLRFSSVTDTLSTGKHFAMVNLGGCDEALLVTGYVYDDFDGHNATICAHVYATDPDGKVVDCGEVFSQGTAYPLSVKDSCLFTAGHRFIQKHNLRNGNGRLIEAGHLLEVLDSLGNPLHYIIDEDLSLPGDSLVLAAYDEWATAEVVSFSLIR